MRATRWVVFVCAFGASASACGDDGGCDAVCAKNVECQPAGPTKESCVSICEQLSNEPAYADAIEEQAECYEDATCDEIASGSCDPDFS